MMHWLTKSSCHIAQRNVWCRPLWCVQVVLSVWLFGALICESPGIAAQVGPRVMSCDQRVLSLLPNPLNQLPTPCLTPSLLALLLPSPHHSGPLGALPVAGPP
jgi:hypothetical protein